MISFKLLFLYQKTDEVVNDQVQSTTSADVPLLLTSELAETSMETSRFASETAESEQESLNVYKEATANAKAAPQIVIEPPAVVQGHGDADNSRTEEDQGKFTQVAQEYKLNLI